MKKKSLPYSVRVYIRKEKSRIRKTNLDSQKQKKMIAELYKHENK